MESSQECCEFNSNLETIRELLPFPILLSPFQVPPRNGSIRQFVTARISLRVSVRRSKTTYPFETHEYIKLIHLFAQKKRENSFKKTVLFLHPDSFTHFTPCKCHFPRHPMGFPSASTSSLCCALQQAKWATLSRKAAFNLPEGREKEKQQNVGQMKFRFGTEKIQIKLSWSYDWENFS